MPRSRQAALIAFALTAVAVGAVMTTSAASQRGSTTPAQAVHAAQAARSPVTVTLDSGTVEWRATPYATVGAFWYAGESLYFNAFGTADSTGRVVLTWTDPTPERTDDDRPFEELDRLVLDTANVVGFRDAYTITLPALDAEADAPADRLALRGPAGATLAVRLRRAIDRDVLALTGTDVVRRDASGEGGALAGQRASGEPGRSVWAGTVTVGGDGEVDVPLAGTADVQPGDTVEVQRVWAGDTFVVRRTALQLVVGDERTQPIAYGRPGARMTLAIGHGGRQRSCATTIGRAGWSSWSCGEPIAAGDRITVSYGGGLLPPVRTAATIPPLAFRPGAGAAPATITGSPNARVRFVEVDALGGPSGFDVGLGAQGQAALPTGRPARGSRYAYAWRSGGGITWGRGGFVPQIRFVLGEPRLRGVWPSLPVTVTVADRDGTPLGRWSRARTTNGDTRPIPLFDARSGPQGPLHRLAPGNRVDVAVGGDEPVVWALPDLALRLDADTNVLTGRLPLGTRGTLTVLEHIDGDPDPLRSLYDLGDGSFGHRATLPLSPSPDGAFTVALTGLRDLDGFRLPAHRLVLYVVSAERADGNAVMAVLARPWLRIDGQAVTAEGFGPSGQAVEIDVTDAHGRPVARRRSDGASAATIDRPIWRIPLVDDVGARTALRPGDRVVVTVGASRAALTATHVEAYVDLPGRAVRGRAAPNASLTVVLSSESWGERRFVVHVRSDGAFDLPVPADVPLQGGDWGQILGRAGPHVITAPILVPWLLVDLSAGRIWGRGPAGAPVDVTVLRGGVPVAAGRRLVDDWLGFDLDPHDAGGRHVVPAPGDVVVQRIAGRPPVTITVPAVAARWQQAEAAIVGTSPPGSRVDVYRPTEFALTSADWDVGFADVAATGAFTVPASHRLGLTTGLNAVVEARVPAGVSAWRRVVTPILNIPHGGDSICGQAMPWARVHTAVTSGGSTTQGEGVADAVGRFRIPLHRTDGRPVVLAAGDVVRAEVDGTALEATLPALTFRVDRAAGRGSGTAPPTATVSLEYPAGSCAPDDDSEPADGAGWHHVNQTVPDPSGAFSAPLPMVPSGLAASRPWAYEAAILDAAGHRHYRLSRALRLTAHVDTDRVLGEADSGRAVAVTLTRPGGFEARGTAVADAVGRFTATLVADNGGGSAVRLQAGDSIAATADGETRRMTVPPLAVDWHAERGLQGRTDAGATVHVRFVLPRGLLLAQDTDVAFTLTADANGRFASAGASARGAWAAADVRRVEVWRSFEDDDRAMAAFDVAGGAAPTPGATAGPPIGGGVGRALLPWAGRGAGE